jgi:hypothetical protein
MSEEVLGSVELDHSPIPDGCCRRLDEVTIKRHGEVWQIYVNDADPFPSNPHAHNGESGLKLHLGNGELFLGASNTGKSVVRKDLLAIRQQAEAKGIGLPPLAV